MTDSFRSLPLSDALLANLDSIGYERMTPIQAAALPPALAGEDLIAQAKTGSGKTAVFGLALLSRLDLSLLQAQALILCPTRELSIQVATEIRRLARNQQNVQVSVLYGGQPVSRQKLTLKHGTHIVVGTPGRIKDLMEKEALSLKKIHTLVLDEADRMLEMGFRPEIEFILRSTPGGRQTLLFSATFPENIEDLSARYQRNPTRIAVDERHGAAKIRQQVYLCGKINKLDALKTVLMHYLPASTLIFCNLKQSTRDICDFLNREGFSCLALNGDLEQREREEILIKFKHLSSSVLVATDVAARGLDIKSLAAVINYELPRDPEVYVHRIGRTGRAGESGLAFSLIHEDEKLKLREFEELLGIRLQCKAVQTLPNRSQRVPNAPNVTFCIAGGRRDKLRPGEILGTLTADGGVQGSDVGSIDVMDYASYVAVRRDVAGVAERKLNRSKIKGRSFKIRTL